MSDNLTEAFSNLKKMVDSGNIPSELQEMIGNLSKPNNENNNSNLNNLLNQVSPEMLNNLSSMLGAHSTQNASTQNPSSSVGNSSSLNSSTSDSNNSFNIDMETLMKMTSIMNSMNQKDSASTNLLHSLKPYLRDSRKGKLDQYVNLLNVTKIAEVMKNDKKENNKNA